MSEKKMISPMATVETAGIRFFEASEDKKNAFFGLGIFDHNSLLEWATSRNDERQAPQRWAPAME